MKNKKNNRGMHSTPRQPETHILENWIDNLDASNILKICVRTLARWRKERGLPYAKVGRKIYMHKDLINQYLASRLRVD